MNRLQKALISLVLIGLFCLSGCESGEKVEPPLNPEQLSDYLNSWRHDLGTGVPYRISVLRDGTEFLSIGQYENGEFVVFIRGDQNGFVVNPDEIVSIE